jgi:hypothetical protein
VSYYWKTAAGNKSLTFDVLDAQGTSILNKSIGADVDWSLVNDIQLEAGEGKTYSLIWTYTSDDVIANADETAWIDTVQVSQLVENDFEYAGYTQTLLPDGFVTSAPEWISQNSVYYGVSGFAAKAAAVYAGLSVQCRIRWILQAALAPTTLDSYGKCIRRQDPVCRVTNSLSLEVLICSRVGTDWTRDDIYAW